MQSAMPRPNHRLSLEREVQRRRAAVFLVVTVIEVAPRTVPQTLAARLGRSRLAIGALVDAVAGVTHATSSPRSTRNASAMIASRRVVGHAVPYS